MNIKNLLLEKAEKFPLKPSIIFEDKTITFKELKESVFLFSQYLLNSGIRKGDKVSIYLPNLPEYIISYLSIWNLGATAVPLDFMFTQSELENMILHSESKILICEEKKGINFEELKRKTNLKKIIFLEDFKNIDKNLKYKNSVQINPEDLALIFYTSGTTGVPKGVMIPYENLEIPPKNVDYFLDISESDICLCSVPLSHAGGWVYLLLMLYKGVTVILMQRFEPLKFLKNIEKYKVTIFWIVPSMYIALLVSKEIKKIDLSSLKYAVVFGAPSSPHLLKKFHKFCPNAKLLNGWGMTETSAPNIVTPPFSEKIESVGKPVPWIELKIVDEDGKALGQNEIGELLIKGKGLFKGYYKNEELTKASFTCDGFFKTGDLAKVDQEGFYYIVGRKKEMIKVGGEIVFENEIEKAILTHPKVKDVAVIGVPDTLRGEVPKAFVVLKEKKTLSEFELKEFLKSKLAHFKIPHYIEFVTELPKTRSGKINKELLRRKIQ